MKWINKIKQIYCLIKFLKSLLYFFWNFVKRYFSQIVIIATLIISIFSLVATDKSLSITKQETEKRLDPLIHYKYQSDKKRFEILSSDDIEIKAVSWALPINSEFKKINEFSNDLILDELKYSFLIDLSNNTNKSKEIIKSFIDCYLFGSEFYKGVSLVTEIEFRRRGSRETFKQVDLVRIRGSERDGLNIYTEKPGSSIEEAQKFKTEAQEDFKIYQDFLKDYNLKGECGIRFGYPEKNLW